MREDEADVDAVARELPERLVAARIAEDMLLPDEPAVAPELELEAPREVLPPDRAVTCWLPPPEKLAVLVPLSRPNPLRLPRICGTVRDTNRSAPVVPARRRV